VVFKNFSKENHLGVGQVEPDSRKKAPPDAGDTLEAAPLDGLRESEKEDNEMGVIKKQHSVQRSQEGKE